MYNQELLKSRQHIFLIMYFIELQQLEQQVNGMGPLIDAELELVDRR